MNTTVFLTQRTMMPFLPVFAAMVLGLVSSESQGATVTASSPANATGDWLQNWTGAVTSDGTFLLPDAAIPDTAIINQGRTIEVTAPVSVNPGAVIVGNTASGQNEAILNVNAGGDLTMTGGTLTISADTDAGTVNVQGGTLTTDSAVTVQAGGTFNLSSGSFTNNGTGARPIFQNTNGTGGTLNITGGSLTALGAAPTDVLRFENDFINISGGTLNATGGQVLLADTTTLTVTGNSADITMDRLNLNTASRAATLNFDFGASGISPIKNNSFLGLSNATLNIDGTNYAGGSGSFDLFTAPNVASTAPTVNVNGFGIPGVDYTFEQNTATNVVRLNVLPAPLPANQALLNVFPASTQAPINPGNWSYSHTNNLDLSGSTWEPGLDEIDVYHAALKHNQQVGKASQAWEIRIGKGGHIYSIRSEVGEIIPPQVRVNNPGFSPWNDEVFQAVSVDTTGNPPGVNNFYHQSGYYVDGTLVTEPTYAPILASGDVGDNAYSTLSLGVQPKANDPQQPSGVLNWQRTKDLGEGVVEITNTLYNFGDHTLNFHNMPWGGSRNSVFNHMLVSNPGGGFTDQPILSWGEGQTINSSATDGWVAFAEGTDPTDRAMALVIGNADEHLGEAWQNAPSDWRWGGTGVDRDYLVGTLRRRVNVDPGDVFYSRYFMVFGEVGEIESLINAQSLAADATYNKQLFTEATTSRLSWRVVESNGVVSVEEVEASQSHFMTFAQPVNGSKPLFLFEDDQGNEVISIDPYSLSDFPYDGATLYKGLLGFVLPEAIATGSGPYVDLASLFPEGSNYYLDSDNLLAEFALAGSVVQGLEADFNGDNVINGDDLTDWQLAFGNGAGADADADGDSDGNDFLIWQRQLGNSLSAPSAATVPEPTGILLILGACAIATSTRCFYKTEENELSN